ncbi:hypothetical protein LV779_25645 [Streptomyces thinghirensis]|nr:hypothetical protein [Streptomyces thinghirensis]
MPAGVNVPVLIGAVPLFTVTSLSLGEGYQVARIAGSRLAQLVAPTTKSISVEAVLVGRTRLLTKKAWRQWRSPRVRWRAPRRR